MGVKILYEVEICPTSGWHLLSPKKSAGPERVLFLLSELQPWKSLDKPHPKKRI
jgi:hypothetical protein